MFKSSVEDNHFEGKSIKINGKIIDFKTPKIMGIINLTEDSFYSKSRQLIDYELLKQIERFIHEGSDFIDLGAFSTRPGAKMVSEDVEIKTIHAALKLIRSEFKDVLISVDTFRSNVASVAIDEGAQLINDIGAAQFDEQILEVVGKHDVAYVMMHNGTSFSQMHADLGISEYPEMVVQRVKKFFKKKLNLLAKFQIENVILDPGFGFHKTMNENYALLKHLDEFKSFSQAILIGLSRKSMIYKHLNTNPDDALAGTLVLNTIALTKGADILRVHDVKECKQLVHLMSKLNSL